MRVPPIVARQRLGKDITMVTNTRATVEELLDPSFFYADLVVWKESIGLVLSRTSYSFFIISGEIK
jgi:hypothetical protein